MSTASSRRLSLITIRSASSSDGYRLRASLRRTRKPSLRERGTERKICFPITSRAYYGRSQLLIRKLHAHPGVDLKLMLGGSILLDKYSRHVADDIAAGGFEIEASLFNVIEGGNHVAMAKTACLTALEFTNGFFTTKPDVVVICGDRFEQLAIAMAAAYLNITIAHIEGGDVTGSIDESVRHAITKLAHVHFVTNEDAHRRVLAMGEDPRYVFNTGSLDVELAAHVSTTITSEHVNALGVGHDIDIERPFLMVVQHPVTTEARQPRPSRDDVEGGGVVRAADDLVLAESRRRHRRDVRHAARHARTAPGAHLAHAFHHQRAGRATSSRCSRRRRAWSATRRPASRSVRSSALRW